MISDKIPEILYGGDYNPEQWPEPVWIEDIELMKKAGVNLVTICVFSWAKLNPAPGKFNFGWLDKLMDLLDRNGIYADLATPTASPPAWLGIQFPDSKPVDRDGTYFHHGSRRNYTPCSHSYRKYSTAIVDVMAQRYKDHPALAMWHVDNEIGSGILKSYGPEDTKMFRKWLHNKYSTIDSLNEAWGTSFWGQTYYDWDEILTPCKSPAGYNPEQELDFFRFFSDMYLEIYMMQREILKKYMPSIPVTTNLMGFQRTINHKDIIPWLDVIAIDTYPNPDPLAKSKGNPDIFDSMRSYKAGSPWMVMEQATSNSIGKPNRPKVPGLMRLWSYQALARGSEGLMFFQWRQSKFGGEKYFSAMVPHVGAEKSRIFGEVCRLGQELKKLTPIMGSTVSSEVAFLVDWNNMWALEIKEKNQSFKYTHRDWYDAFYYNNIPVDFIFHGADLSNYKCVVAPLLYLLRKEDADALRSYVAQGGTLILTYFSGIVNENGHVVTGGYPSYLRDVLGLYVEEWDPYPEGYKNTVTLVDGGQFDCSFFAEIIHPISAQVLGKFENEFYKGSPALTVNHYGKGKAYYFGTHPDKQFLVGWITQLLSNCKIEPPLKLIPGVEIVRRKKEDKTFMFILNHNDGEATVSLGKAKGTDLLTGEVVTGNVTLQARDVAVISLDS